MKRFIVTVSGLIILLLGVEVFAQGTTYVNPYVRRDGTYVPGHVRTTPDNTLQNNYGTTGNVNPYTGAIGTVNPYRPRR